MTVDRTEQIRAGRLLLAGLVVGLTMNAGEAALHGGILVEAAEATYAALNLTASADPMNLVSLIVLTFAQGMLMAWLYAVVRPFFGTRPKTAVCVGLVGWLLSSVYAAVYLHSGFPGIFPHNLVWVPVAWQLIEYPLATLAGAVTYGQ